MSLLAGCAGALLGLLAVSVAVLGMLAASGAAWLYGKMTKRKESGVVVEMSEFDPAGNPPNAQVSGPGPGDQVQAEKTIVAGGYEKARRIGMMAMVGGKDKTRIRNATPVAFRRKARITIAPAPLHRLVAPTGETVVVVVTRSAKLKESNAKITGPGEPAQGEQK